MLLRTAKSCGPDAPTLASSLRSCVGPTGLRQNISADDGGKRARSPGRARRKPLKPLRAGMPGDSGVLVVTRVRSITTSAHEAAGATGIRRSPRPLRGERFINASGASRCEGVNSCLRRLFKAIAPHFQSSSPAKEPAKNARPHPEELAKQASRRMDTTYGLPAILRDARKSALLRMRSEIFHNRESGRSSAPRRP